MNTAQISLLQKKTKNILQSIVYHNDVDLSAFAADANWFVGAEMLCLQMNEIPEYLAGNAIEQPASMPQFQFTYADYIGENGASIVGELRYQGELHPDWKIQVNFHANWILQEDAWKLRQLFTNSKHTEEDTKSDNGETRIDGRLLLKSVAIGIACCLRNEQLPINLLNDTMLSMLKFASVNDFRNMFGNSILNAVHSNDIEDFMAYVHRIGQGPVEDYVNFRIRTRDFQYIWVQAFGMVAQEKWIVLACVDFTDHQKRLEEIAREKEKLATLHENYRLLIDNMPSGFHRCQLYDPVHVDYVSEGFCKMTGYSQYDIHETMKSEYIQMVVP